MTILMMVLLGIGFLLVVIGVGLEVGSNNKIVEWIATVFNAAGGFIIGMTVVTSSLHDYIQGIPPRAPNVANVKFGDDGTVNLPPPTELGVHWCVIHSETGSTGAVVLTESVKVPVTDTLVKLYLVYPDGRTSSDVVVNKGTTLPGPGAAPAGAGT